MLKAFWCSKVPAFLRVTVPLCLLAACAVPAPSPTDTPEATASPTSERPSYGDVYLELLQNFPDTPEVRSFVAISNYEIFRETSDISIPPPDADRDTLLQYFIDTALPGPFISGYGNRDRVSSTLDNWQHLAFDMRHVDQAAEARTPRLMNMSGQFRPPLEVVRGRIDPEATGQAIAACDECQPPEIRERHGVSFYSWGEDLRGGGDLQLRNQPPAFDHLGRGGRVAVLEGYVLRTLSTDSMEAMLDARLGERPSLADDEAYRMAVEKLAEMAPHYFVLSELERNTEFYRDSYKPSHLLDTFQEELAETPPLAPYSLLAAGQGADAQGCYLAVALVHDAAETAQENVARLTRRLEETSMLFYLSYPLGESSRILPWSEVVEEVDIQASGRVLWGRIRLLGESTGLDQTLNNGDGDSYERGARAAFTHCSHRDREFQLDPLFMHE